MRNIVRSRCDLILRRPLDVEMTADRQLVCSNFKSVAVYDIFPLM